MFEDKKRNFIFAYGNRVFDSLFNWLSSTLYPTHCEVSVLDHIFLNNRNVSRFGVLGHKKTNTDVQDDRLGDSCRERLPWLAFLWCHFLTGSQTSTIIKQLNGYNLLVSCLCLGINLLQGSMIACHSRTYQ